MNTAFHAPKYGDYLIFEESPRIKFFFISFILDFQISRLGARAFQPYIFSERAI